MAGDVMAESGIRESIIENRHSGERLAMRRVKRGDEVWLELKGSLPPHRQGPPLHIHVAEDEEGVVRSGTLSAVLNGRRFTAGSGERVSLPRGSTHRWWNDGNEPLVFEGHAAARSRLGPISSSDLRSPQKARPASLRSSTWPISSYGIVIRRPSSSCRDRFKPCCFE
jgi:mannose-6-phosphate isomerase-like protein (cupin superfamily)